MYYAEGTHEPIIDQATFDKAQERLRMLAQQAANRKKPTRSVFSGLIHCGLCGNTYKRVTYRKNTTGIALHSRQKENPNVPLSGFQKKRSKSSPARCWAQ